MFLQLPLIPVNIIAMNKISDTEKKSVMLARLQRDHEIRQTSYRARALKLFPHVCGRCGRELTGKRLSELTVHHKDHNHNNNPNDGSNWELLCIYCHDDEHDKMLMKGVAEPDAKLKPSTLFNPFDKLDNILPRQ